MSNIQRINEHVRKVQQFHDEKQSLLNMMVDISPESVRGSAEIMWLKDHTGAMYALSAGYSRYFNVSQEFYEGQFDEVVHGDDIGGKYQEADRIVRQNQSAVIVEESWISGAGLLEKGWVLKMAVRVAGKLGTYGYIFKHTIVSNNERVR